MAPRKKKKEEKVPVGTTTISGRVSKKPKAYVQNCVMNFAKVAKCKDKKKNRNKSRSRT